MKGRFKPANPGKYKGNPNNIIYRSSWELSYMFKLDRDPNVISWSSEEIIVPYKSPLDNRFHSYFPDFSVTRINKGQKITELIEIKPDRQTRPPVKKQRVTKKYIAEVRMFGINEAKWKAAEAFALRRGWKFRILTERHLGIG